jgi:hypothetical protein
MALSKGWREFLELLNSRGVDYVIVGAQSLAFHGRPCYTGDLDILVRPTPENARLLLNLLNQFGFAQSGFKETDFMDPEQMIQLGRAPNRIDLLTSISGVSADEAFTSEVSAELDGIRVFILGRDALIRNKRALGRPQDLADSEIISPYPILSRTSVAFSASVLRSAERLACLLLPSALSVPALAV